jgi:VanZ family protein
VSASTRRLALRALAPLALMGLIFYLSAQPFEGPDLAWWEVLLRKGGHVAGYAALTALWAWALVGSTRAPLLLAAGISLLYAVSDEYHQTFVEGRSGTPVDVVIDSVGILLASAVLHRRVERLRRGRLRTEPA